MSETPSGSYHQWVTTNYQLFTSLQNKCQKQEQILKISDVVGKLLIHKAKAVMFWEAEFGLQNLVLISSVPSSTTTFCFEFLNLIFQC